MKKLWKLIALTLVVVFAVAAIAAAAPIPIVDPNNALTKADVKSLEGRIKELERKHSINIGVLLLTVPNGKQSGAVASGYLTQNGYANAVNGGVVLLLDLQNHGWYVATDKKMEKGHYRRVRRETSGHQYCGQPEKQQQSGARHQEFLNRCG
jgi:uncharacterized membrane protein YgcG